MGAHTIYKPSAPTCLMNYGATSHITNEIYAIQYPTPYNGQDKVYIGDGQGMPIHHTGTTILTTHAPTFCLNNVLHPTFHLNNVPHVPAMKHNLLSAYQFLRDNHCKLTLDSKIKDRISGMMFFLGPVKHGFYPYQRTLTATNSPSTLFSSKVFLQVWHNRLGHPSSTIYMKALNSSTIVYIGKKFTSFFCSDCANGKNHKLLFTASISFVSVPLELVHCDVWGPAPTSSVSGYKYYVLFVNEFTKY
ncbi:hypothetical protein ACFX1S_013113 [Malus domestica]